MKTPPVITVQSAALVGIEAVPIEVEVSIQDKLPLVIINGKVDQTSREMGDRVRSAIVASGFTFPKKRIVVNLMPTDVRHTGTHYDLPIALAILAASGQLDPASLEGVAAFGELALDGLLRPMRGALPLCEECESDVRPGTGCIVPLHNAGEAVLAGGPNYGARTLREAVDHLAGGCPLPEAIETVIEAADTMSKDDVKGPQRAMLDKLGEAIAAGKRVLLMGQPGSGKTMLAARAGLYLPQMSHAEALEVTRIASVAGLLRPGDGLVTRRPFRAPHHSVSAAGMIGNARLMPGEVTLAHRGVLFLDELPEFGLNVIETVGAMARGNEITMCRGISFGSTAGMVRFPADFALIAAANPCPCGWLGHPTRECRCPPSALDRYRARLDSMCRVLGIDTTIQMG